MTSTQIPAFDPNCRRCPRLATFLDEVKVKEPRYFARPVPPFGVEQPKLLIVGLAPGMHGANRTGRPFTGDYAGTLLYSTLHKFGFSTSPEPLDAAGWANPDLQLVGCRITNAVKCLPPENKPETSEVVTCNGYLASELASLPQGAVVLALGSVAHGAVLRAMKLRPKDYPFGHGARHELPAPSPQPLSQRARGLEALSPTPLPLAGEGLAGGALPEGERRALVLYDSYHCSRYNTQTKRLTEAMFHTVFESIVKGA